MTLGAIITIISFIIGIVAGIPLGWLFIGSTCLGLLVIDLPANFVMGTLYHSLDNYVLMAIGFFVFAGSLISAGGLADRIVAFSYMLVGKVRGGMILVGIIATLFMSALTGSSVPCISALIPLLVPRLEKFGYKKEYTTAVLCSTSFMGYLIPPSVPAMIYCLVARQSVAAVFLSTVIPGLLLGLGYAILNFWICPKYIDKSIATLQEEERLSFTKYIRKFTAVTWGAILL